MIKRVALPEPEAQRESGVGNPRRIVAWLAKRRGLYADASVVAALSRCATLPALEFAASLLSTRGWRQSEPTVFENHAYRLEIEPTIGAYSVNLLFSSRLGREVVAFDIVSETATENLQRSNDQRATEIRRFVTRYVRMTVGHMPKALHWLKTSLRKDLGRRTEADLPPPLVGRIDREDLDWKNVPPPVRQTRLDFWLEAHREVVDEKYWFVLAQCETTTEMRFLIPLLQQISWDIRDQNWLRHQKVDLKVHWPAGDAHFDFVIEHRTSKLFRPVVIEIDRPPILRGDSSAFERVRAAAESARLPIEVVSSADAAARGSWWARLLKEAAANDHFQSRELKGARAPI